MKIALITFWIIGVTELWKEIKMTKLKKILIVPARAIIEKEPSQPAAAFFMRAAKFVKRRLWRNTSVYDGELQFYADTPAVLGKDNVYTLGRYLPHFYSPAIPNDLAYPSCHGIPRSSSVQNLREAISLMPQFSVVIVSSRAGLNGKAAIAAARKYSVPVAIIDFKDHYSIFGGEKSEAELFRGFVRGRDFDLYFKKDLPLGWKDDVVLPLAPVPVRPESYHFRNLPKDTNIFYSGKMRPKGTGDRGDIVDLVKHNFSGSKILEHVDHSTFLSLRDYLDWLSRAKIALSPSGVVWDSFRHCEVGLASETLLFAPRAYMEVVGPRLEDGVNALLYETEFRDGKCHLIKESELVEKIKFYLESDHERVRVANNWARDVRDGHTGIARVRYILESIEKIL